MENNQKPKIEISFIVDMIYGDAMQNKFMHAADVFEAGKILGSHERIKVRAEALDEDAKNAFLNNLIQSIKSALESEQKVVSFIAIREINLIISPEETHSIKNTSIEPYIKPNVQTISNGQQYSLFSDLLNKLGYEVTTSEYMHVLTAKLKI